MDTQDSTPATDDGQLRSFVERIERLLEERKTISDDMSDVYSEAKGTGYDVAALKLIIRERAADPSKWCELEAIAETYRRALGMPSAEVAF